MSTNIQTTFVNDTVFQVIAESRNNPQKAILLLIDIALDTISVIIYPLYTQTKRWLEHPLVKSWIALKNLRIQMSYEREHFSITELFSVQANQEIIDAVKALHVRKSTVPSEWSPKEFTPNSVSITSLVIAAEKYRQNDEPKTNSKTSRNQNKQDQ